MTNNVISVIDTDEWRISEVLNHALFWLERCKQHTEAPIEFMSCYFKVKAYIKELETFVK